jgi:hypothetical protein
MRRDASVVCAARLGRNAVEFALLAPLLDREREHDRDEREEGLDQDLGQPRGDARAKGGARRGGRGVGLGGLRYRWRRRHRRLRVGWLVWKA